MNIEACQNMRYRERARGEGGFVDCFGLVRLLLQDAGVELPEYSGEHLDDIPGGDLHAYLSDSQWHKVDSPRAYDLIYLWFGGQPSHIALAINEQELINIRKGCNVAVEPIFGTMWRHRLHSFYRHESML